MVKPVLLHRLRAKASVQQSGMVALPKQGLPSLAGVTILLDTYQEVRRLGPRIKCEEDDDHMDLGWTLRPIERVAPMPYSEVLKKHSTKLLAALAIVLLIGAVSLLQANENPATVAKVNGVEISRETFYDALERFMVNGETLGSIALRQLISETLVLQANATYELGVDDAAVQAEYDAAAALYGEQFPALLAQAGLTDERFREEIRLSLILNRLVTRGIEVTEEEIVSFYEQNKENVFYVPETYRASQILVASEEEARELLDRLAEGATFAALRAEHSLDQGVWGPLSKSDPIPKEIADVLFSLQVGEVSEPVQVGGGYYLIRLEEIVPGDYISLEDAYEDIRQHLLYSKAPSVEQTVAKLWEEANIQIDWARYSHLANN